MKKSALIPPDTPLMMRYTKITGRAVFTWHNKRGRNDRARPGWLTLTGLAGVLEPEVFRVRFATHRTGISPADPLAPLCTSLMRGNLNTRPSRIRIRLYRKETGAKIGAKLNRLHKLYDE